MSNNRIGLNKGYSKMQNQYLIELFQTYYISVYQIRRLLGKNYQISPIIGGIPPEWHDYLKPDDFPRLHEILTQATNDAYPTNSQDEELSKKLSALFGTTVVAENIDSGGFGSAAKITVKSDTGEDIHVVLKKFYEWHEKYMKKHGLFAEVRSAFIAQKIAPENSKKIYAAYLKKPNGYILSEYIPKTEDERPCEECYWNRNKLKDKLVKSCDCGYDNCIGGKLVDFGGIENIYMPKYRMSTIKNEKSK